MRLLDKLLRRGRDRKSSDRRLETALIEGRVKAHKRGVREQRDLNDYPSRGVGSGL